MDSLTRILHERMDELLRLSQDQQVHAFCEFVRKTVKDSEDERHILKQAVEALSLQLADQQKLSEPSSRSLANVKGGSHANALQQLIQNIPFATCLLDRSGRLLETNNAWLRHFAVSEEHLADIESHNLIDWLAPRFDTPDLVRLFFEQCIHTTPGHSNRRLESSPLTRDKVSVTIYGILIELGSESLIVWLFYDQSEVKKLRMELKESDERFQLAAQGANDGLWDWHLKTNELYFSPRWLNMLGYSDKDFHNNLADWLNLVHPADKKELSKRLQNHMSKRNSRFRHEYRIQDKMGEYRWVLAQGMLVLDEQGEPYRFAGSQSDITEMKRMEKQLIHDSTHDLLTNLPNRLLFREELGKMMQKTMDTPELSFSILQLNLDQFQLINNGLGHLFGDQVLMIVAGRLLSLVGPQDTVARLGGDEFAILLSNPQSPESVAEFAALILTTLAEPLNVHGQEIVLSAGIGIVIRTPDHSNVGQLLGDAATAMHHAKAMTSGSWILFNEEMRAHAITRIQLESKLRRAIDQHEIQVFFQPIVSSVTGQVDYFEALVRWFDPDKGIINPGAFIPLAEETSLIVPLGEFVLRKSCQEALKWYAAGYKDLSVAVNLSPKQFQQPNIHERIKQVLAETGMHRGKLTLEITESQIMDNPAQAIEILKRLRELGVEISIDDFGTGYSSLAYLKKFPINTLKIDRTFVEGLPEEHDDVEISRAIIALAHSLKLEIVAEGVELESQAQFLHQEGCPLLQGFLFSKPMPAAEVIPWLNQYKPENYAPLLFNKSTKTT